MNIRNLLIKMVENWPVKALSIAIALILFVFHQLNTMTTRPISIPLAIQTNSMLLPASAYPNNVRVRLRGEDEDIKSITDNDIEAFVDFTRHEDVGLYSAPVQIRRKGIALTIEPLEITVSPSKVSVQLDRKISRTVPLTAVIRGRVAEGFDLVSYSIAPKEIAVTGPLSFLESLAEIETEIIDLDGQSNDFTMEVKITNPDPFFIVRGSGTAEFSCVIRPSFLVRSIDNLPIVLVGLNPDFEADFGGKTGSIRIEGNHLRLDDFQPSPEMLTVDCSGITAPGVYTLPVTLSLSPIFSLHRRDPEELSLTVTLKEELF